MLLGRDEVNGERERRKRRRKGRDGRRECQVVALIQGGFEGDEKRWEKWTGTDDGSSCQETKKVPLLLCDRRKMRSFSNWRQTRLMST
jgi:hypothetical protein